MGKGNRTKINKCNYPGCNVMKDLNICIDCDEYCCGDHTLVLFDKEVERKIKDHDPTVIYHVVENSSCWTCCKFPGQKCNTCGKISINLPRCAGCQNVSYCNIDCQRNDWKNGHREQCKKKNDK